MLCAAVDIHKHVFQAVVLDPTSGEVEEERFAADRDRLREWAGRLVGREAVIAVEVELELTRLCVAPHRRVISNSSRAAHPEPAAGRSLRRYAPPGSSGAPTQLPVNAGPGSGAERSGLAPPNVPYSNREAPWGFAVCCWRRSG